VLRKLARDVKAHDLKAGDEVQIVTINHSEGWITIKFNGRYGVVRAEDITHEQKAMEGLDA
jgi:hypothetical protein